MNKKSINMRAKVRETDANALAEWLASRVYNYSVRKGKVAEGAVAVGDIPLESLHRILEYGIQRLHNDAAGNADIETQRARVERRHKSIMTGDWSRATRGMPKLAGFDAFVAKKADTAIRRALGGDKAKAYTALPESRKRDIRKAFMDKNSALVDTWRAEYDALKAVESGESDMSDVLSDIIGNDE